MAQYKRILSGYLNDNKNGNGRYLSITNMTEEPITIEPGGRIFLNETPKEILDKNPNVPLYSKSVKIEEEKVKSPSKAEEESSDNPADGDIPF